MKPATYTSQRPGLNRLRCIFLSVCLCLGTHFSISVAAQSQSDGVQRGISSGQAANIARTATGGKVLSVSPAGDTYKVKVLKGNGVVTNVRIDRASGKVRR